MIEPISEKFLSKDLLHKFLAKSSHTEQSSTFKQINHMYVHMRKKIFSPKICGITQRNQKLSSCSTSLMLDSI